MAEKIGDRLLVAGQTDVGLVRSLNEDSFRVDTRASLLVLADGMGGHDAGEIASASVVDSLCQDCRRFLLSPPGEAEENDDDDVTLMEELETTVVNHAVEPLHATELEELHDHQEDPTVDDMPNSVVNTVLESVTRANARLHTFNQTKGYAEGSGMGTTLVGLWLPNFSEDPVVFHVGDSRLYLLRHGQNTQVTHDHSLYQQWVNFGAKGTPPSQNILLQAMGPSRHVTPEVRFLPIERGDVVLLCSDGLSGMVSEQDIQRTLQAVTTENLDATCHHLIDLAKKGGGRDNVTVIVGYFL